MELDPSHVYAVSFRLHWEGEARILFPSYGEHFSKPRKLNNTFPLLNLFDSDYVLHWP